MFVCVCVCLFDCLCVSVVFVLTFCGVFAYLFSCFCLFTCCLFVVVEFVLGLLTFKYTQKSSQRLTLLLLFSSACTGRRRGGGGGGGRGIQLSVSSKGGGLEKGHPLNSEGVCHGVTASFSWTSSVSPARVFGVVCPEGRLVYGHTCDVSEPLDLLLFDVL